MSLICVPQVKHCVEYLGLHVVFFLSFSDCADQFLACFFSRGFDLLFFLLRHVRLIPLPLPLLLPIPVSSTLYSSSSSILLTGDLL